MYSKMHIPYVCTYVTSILKIKSAPEYGRFAVLTNTTPQYVHTRAYILASYLSIYVLGLSDSENSDTIVTQ